jgi:uncharacterized SAM-binding protein YcdF (DUF218 family)
MGMNVKIGLTWKNSSRVEWARALGRGTAISLALLALLLCLQLTVYTALLRRPPLPAPGETFDLVAVFGGDPERVRTAYGLCRQGRGRALVVSDSDAAQVEAYSAAFGSPGRARILSEPYARTTDQNARLVGRLIRRQGFRSVLLVTSWYHLPRSYLLLRLALLGSGAELKVLSPEGTPNRYLGTPVFREELAKFWGSLGRWIKSGLRRRGLYFGEKILPVD